MARPVVVWLTGLPAAGKTTLARAVEAAAQDSGRTALRLDGDELRASSSADLGFGRAARAEQARRAAALAVAGGVPAEVVLVALVSPYGADRAAARATVEATGAAFVEVHLDTPADECRRRDPKGLYAAAAAGRLRGVTGWDDPYEAPAAPEVRVGHPVGVEAATRAVLDAVAARSLLAGHG